MWKRQLMSHHEMNEIGVIVPMLLKVFVDHKVSAPFSICCYGHMIVIFSLHRRAIEA